MNKEKVKNFERECAISGYNNATNRAPGYEKANVRDPSSLADRLSVYSSAKTQIDLMTTFVKIRGLVSKRRSDSGITSAARRLIRSGLQRENNCGDFRAACEKYRFALMRSFEP
jgi:hypothetical protein